MLNSVFLPPPVSGRTKHVFAGGCSTSSRIEIGGGLGAFKGKIWRIGLMGESSRREKVLRLFSALEQILPGAGVPVRAGVAAGAAEACF